MIGEESGVVAGDFDRLVEVLTGRRMVVLAGAGCSTESGIPDYRGSGTPRRRAPVQYQEFVRDPHARTRYWARSAIGWPRMRASVPNAGHRALAELEDAGRSAGVITQNVDGLHHRAGSARVVELHGSLAQVICLGCGERERRDDFQRRIIDHNQDWVAFTEGGSVESRPDGDAGLPDRVLASFAVPPCAACGGVMKPDVVFFGENVPRAVVDDAWTLFAEGEVLLVAGSSLTVFSGRRFIYRATEQGIPIAVINRGPTRADDVAAARVDGALGEVLPRLVEAVV